MYGQGFFTEALLVVVKNLHQLKGPPVGLVQ